MREGGGGEGVDEEKGEGGIKLILTEVLFLHRHHPLAYGCHLFQ